MRDIGTPSNIQKVLERFNLSAKKSLGQNFLKDPNILRKIVTEAQIDADTVVIEIGPGIGSLTEYLARSAKHVFAFEIDQNLLPVLEYTLDEYDNVTVINQDILTVDYEKFAAEFLLEGQSVSVVANLPYYITTPIIMNLLKSSLPTERMVLMMQKEVAERLEARPSTKAYGSLTLAVQYYARAHQLFDVPRTVFSPQPNVDSVMVELIPYRQKPIESSNPEFLDELIRACFSSRRKTIWNNLRSYFSDKNLHPLLKESLAAAGIDPARRGESLNLQEFVTLEREISKRLEMIE